MNSNIPALFESGVADYFHQFGHRQARESPHQAWLLMSVSRHISSQLVVAELHGLAVAIGGWILLATVVSVMIYQLN